MEQTVATPVENAEGVFYSAYPFHPSPERYEIVSAIMRKMLSIDSIFSDYSRGCDSVCGHCPTCERALAGIAWNLNAPRTRGWEVWAHKDSGIELAGFMYLTNILPGQDANAHYVFFDGRLKDKTSLLEDMIQWTFTDHPEEGWTALRRLTVEIPAFAFALARHASRYLGFGGTFTYPHGSSRLQIEGLKRNAILWRGETHDVLILGRENA